MHANGGSTLLTQGWARGVRMGLCAAGLLPFLNLSTSAQTAAPPAVAGFAASASSPAIIAAPRASDAETKFVARMDAAIAPLRDRALAAEDGPRIKEAVARFAANDPAKGREIAGQITDPVGRKLVDWVRLRVGLGDPAEYRRFLEQNHTWPDRNLLTQRMEEAIFTAGGSSRAIREAFAGSEPKSGVGFAALASAYLAEGDNDTARKLAAHAWRTLDIPATFETAFLERFGALLTPADHKRRFDRLSVDDIRWQGERGERLAFARRMVPRLPAAEQARAEARLAVFTRAANAAQLMASQTVEPGSDWGFTFHQIQTLRRTARGAEAAKLMLSVPTDPAVVANLDDWWEERRALAYDALKAGNAALAYDLVKAAGPLSVNPLKDQTFLAGWIAFRYRGDAKTGERHFTELRKAADGPLSLSRGDYWLGRTAEAQGDAARAATHYKAAAQYIDTFHGQLARLKLTGSEQAFEVGLPAGPAAAEIAAFNALDAAQAAVVARRAGVEPGIIRAFLAHFVRSAKTEGEAALTAHLAEALGDTQMAVRVGKLAISRGFALYNYAYPIHPMPAFHALRQPPEPALLLAIARQESEFNTRTVSGAGAKGILQVMTVTAQHVCRDYKIRCEIDRLLADPSYNAMIASAYIGDRMAEFQGSYVLAFAGYNAGPGRARQWIGEFGDPRDPKVDPIDWIHRIPFEETREYVQKVLANVQVYRSRIGEPVRALRISEDLVRARGQQSAAPRGAAAAATAPVHEPAAPRDPPPAATPGFPQSDR